MGCTAAAWIVALEALFPEGWARGVAGGAWAVAVALLTWWADSHRAYPYGASRRVLVATAMWFGSYLFVVGPLVRWRADTSLVWWSIASVVMASPFFVAAWLERRRS
jgi:hypothetical protein